ncbi:hypothetical protein LINGRAPRIM_LOCUS2873 [Linum grandiflorum]
MRLVGLALHWPSLLGSARRSGLAATSAVDMGPSFVTLASQRTT